MNPGEMGGVYNDGLHTYLERIKSQAMKQGNRPLHYCFTYEADTKMPSSYKKKKYGNQSKVDGMSVKLFTFKMHRELYRSFLSTQTFLKGNSTFLQEILLC